MALRIWLPLNGSLENKGISNVSFTNNGATVNANGKISQCYYFNGNSKITATNVNISTSPISASVWIYLDTNITDLQYIISLNNTGGYSNQQIALAIENSKYYFVAGGISTNNIGTPTLNTWTHLAVTFDGTTIRGYVNGMLVKSNTSSATLQQSNFTIGARKNGTNVYTGHFKGKINDVRVYDHCLSAAEVKEIAQGLVLHYKLDDNYENQWNYNATIPTGNVYTNPTFESSSGWSHWGPSGSSHISGQNSDKQYIFNKNYSYSHYISESSGTGKYYLLYQIKDSPGGARSLQCIIKEENSVPITNSVVWPTLNSRTGGAAANRWTTIKYLGDGFYYCKYENVIQSQQTGTNALFGIGVSPGYKVYVSEMYLENSETCTSIFNNTIIQDSSGYGHNGTITGNISIASNSVRYSNSIYTPSGNTDYITSPTLQLPGDAITMNFWFKSSNKTPGSDYHMPLIGKTDSSNQPYEMSIFSTGYLRGGLVVAGSRKVANCTSTKLTDGNWHMCTMTYDGSIIKRYVDGVMEKSTSATGTLVTSAQFILGHYGNNTSYYSKEAYTSDVRIYVTALSPDDVLALYHTGAKVDNLQNLHTFEIKETNNNLLAGKVWTSSYSNRIPNTNPFTNFNSKGEYQFTANGNSAGSEYIPINPSGHTYEYDYTISVNAGNQFYIGFERYDAEKTTRSNNACIYTYSTKPSADIVKQHFTGTVNLSTDGTNPCAFIRLRILNGWSGTTSGVTGTATIHSFSLREIGTKQQPKLTKQGQFIEEEIKEETNTKLHKNGIVETNTLIER